MIYTESSTETGIPRALVTSVPFPTLSFNNVIGKNKSDSILDLSLLF